MCSAAIAPIPSSAKEKNASLANDTTKNYVHTHAPRHTAKQEKQSLAYLQARKNEELAK